MNKTVFITGCSSGIGRATALEFHNAGWNVAATMRKPFPLIAGGGSGGIFTPALDVTDSTSIRNAIEEVIGKFERIDVVVNNAGYGLVGPFEAAAAAQIERQFQTNVFGVMNVVREIMPHFRAQGGGTIVNVASMGGRITFPLYSLYHATKWAVEGFSESLHYELAPFGIRVKIIEPGPIKTDFYDRSMDVMTKEGLVAYDRYVSKAMPNMQKAGATAPGPEVVAKAIFRAATDESSRMRYAPNARAILVLRRLLPDRLFHALVKMSVGVS